MKLRKVLSGFDGMQCGRLALLDAEIEFEEYYASEIDKHAVYQTTQMFPDTIHLGDITKWREWSIDWSQVDLFIFGSPCQGFSRAGKGLNFDHPGSKLFFVCVDILDHIRKYNPSVLFFMENVDMDSWCLGVISRYLGVYPVNINSNLVSAQNRNRWYWSNIKTRVATLFNEIHTDFPQPVDQKIYLKDILEPEETIPEKYYIKNINIGFEGIDITGKGNTLRTGGGRSQSDKHNYDLIKIDKKGNIKADQNKAGCFTAGGNSGGNHSDMDLFCVRMVGRKILDGKRADSNENVPTVQRLERVKEVGKTNCLTTVEKDNLLMIGGIKDGDFEVGGTHSQAARVYSIEAKGVSLCALGGGGGAKTGLYLTQKARGHNKGGDFYEKTPTITSNSWEHNNHLNIEYRIRRLTPREASRLQTIPEWYQWYVSDTQIYRMCGNGWTMKAISHMFKFIKYL